MSKKLGKAKKREGDGEGGEDCKTFFSLWCQEIFVILVKGKLEVSVIWRIGSISYEENWKYQV